MTVIQKLTFPALLIALLVSTPSTQAQTNHCGPVWGGAILNVGAECLNDSAALTVQTTTTYEGWQYEADSSEDGVSGGTIGGTAYEFYGMAFLETPSEACITVNGNLPIEGVPNGNVLNGSITWGDIFINVTSDITGDFLSTNDLQELFAVRFSEFNDSMAADLGVYSSVDGKSVTSQNTGFGTMGQHKNKVLNANKLWSFGEFDVNQTYYDWGISYNVIDQHSFLGDITLLSEQQLIDRGYDITRYAGIYTYGFCFQKTLIKDPCGVVGGDGSSCKRCDGYCGTGLLESGDDDNDGSLNCDDECPVDKDKSEEGVCGCGIADTDIDSDSTLDCNDECPNDPTKTIPGECGCGVAETFCQEAVCNDGILQAGEHCDDGNANNLDGCTTTCKFTEDVAAEIECEVDSTFDLQAALDQLVKRMDRLNRRAAQMVTKLSLRKKDRVWKKDVMTRSGEAEYLAWFYIWTMNSEHVSCNAAGELLCSVVSNEEPLIIYSSNLDILKGLGKEIKRKLRKTVKKYGSKSQMKLVRKYRKQIKNLTAQAESGLADMPPTSLDCPADLTS